MEFIVPTAALKAALAPAVRASAPRATNVLLAGVLLEVKDKVLTLTGTDTNIVIATKVSLDSSVDGTALVPGTLLSQIVASLAGETVSFTQSEDSSDIVVKSGRATTKLHTMKAEDFPKIPETTGQVIEISGAELAAVLASVRYAAPSDDSRGPLAGVYVDTSGEAPIAVATDSLRLATCTLPTWAPSEDVATSESVIIPARAVAEISRLNSSDKLKVTIGVSTIRVATENVVVTSRLVSGNYPNWRQIMGMPRDEKFTVDAAELVDSLKRLDPVSRSANHVELSIDAEAGTLTISAASQDGSMVDVIGGVTASSSTAFRVNPRFLSEAVASLSSTSVDVLHSGEATKPLELRRHGSTEARSLLMPIRAV
jgi:DNA polymerase-3 subunit beta